MKSAGNKNTTCIFWGCVLCAIFMFSCARPSSAQMDKKKNMMITLKVLNVSNHQPVSVELECTLKNETPDTYKILKWGTPFEETFNDHMFEVTRYGEPITYIGRQIKRGAPREEDFITINPWGVLSVKFFLENGYRINSSGEYAVRYRKPFINAKKDQGEMQLLPVLSNRVEFRIDK